MVDSVSARTPPPRPLPPPPPRPRAAPPPPPPPRPTPEPAATWGYDQRANALRTIGVTAPRRTPIAAGTPPPAGTIRAGNLALQEQVRRAQPAPRPFDGGPDATKLYDAMKGGLFGAGTDEAKIFAALDGKSPEQIQSIRSAYRDHYQRDLDADLKGELSGSDWTRAQSLLKGDRGAANADALNQAMAGAGTDEAAIFSRLEKLSPAELRDTQKAYKERYGTDLRTALAGELSGTDLTRANALLDGNTARADAATLRNAIAGAGTDEAAIFDLLEKKTPAERKAIERAYQQEYRTPLAQDLAGDLSGPTLDRANALLAGDDVRAKAAQLREGMAGLGTDEKALERALDGTDPAQRDAIARAYTSMYGRELGRDLASETSGDDRKDVQSLLRDGKMTDAQRISQAMRGAGTDDETIQGILRDKTAGEITQLEQDYRARYGRELRADLRSETSGRDRFESEMALRGKVDLTTDAGVEEAVRRARETRDFERSGAGNAIGRTVVDAFGASGANLDRNVARAEQALAAAKRRGPLTAEDRERIGRLAGFATDDVSSYRAAKDSAADTAGTVAATGAAIGLTAITAGAGAPVGAVILSAAVGGGTAKAATTLAIQGGAATTEGVTVAGVTGTVDGALAATGGAVVTNAAKAGGRTALRVGISEAAISGGVSSSTQTALDDNTWRDGVTEGLSRVGASGLTGTLAGAGTAGVLSGTGALARKAGVVRPRAAVGPEAPVPPRTPVRPSAPEAPTPPAAARRPTQVLPLEQRRGAPYAELDQLARNNDSTMNVFATGTPPGREKGMQAFLDYASDPANWRPERVRVQDEVYGKFYQDAVALDARLTAANGGKPIVVVMRGNSGAGKSTALRSDTPLMERLGIRGSGAADAGPINPDAFKSELAKIGAGGERLATGQVHLEGTGLSTRMSRQMFDENRSFVFDKRFSTAEEIQSQVIDEAQKRGYKVVVIDMDADIGTSAQRVAGRPIGGDSPNVPFSDVAKGFKDNRTQRAAVAELSGVDEYHLIKSDLPGGAKSVYSRVGDQAEILDPALWQRAQTIDGVEAAEAQWKTILDERAKAKPTGQATPR